MGFCRTSHALSLVGCALFRLHGTVYFDDFFGASDPEEAAHASMILISFFELLGWEVSGEKGENFGPLTKVPGDQVDLSDYHMGLVRVANTEVRKRELSDHICELVARCRARPGELRVIRERLQFAESQIFGTPAMRHLSIISQHAEHNVRGLLDRELVDSPTFMMERVLNGPNRSVSGLRGGHFTLFTDACFENGVVGLGAVLFNGQGDLVAWYMV